MVKPIKDEHSSLIKKMDGLKDEIAQFQMRLEKSNAAFLNMVDNSSDAVLILDLNKKVLYTNYAAIKLFNRNISDLLGNLLPLKLNLLKLVERDEDKSKAHINIKNGHDTMVEVSVHKTLWNNQPSYVVSFREMTEQKKAKKTVEHLSKHDFLTDLPNRLSFEQKFEKVISNARDNHSLVALLYLDLDNFKMINDLLGHDAGDELLRKVSHIIRGSVRYDDLVARMEGDEFVLILNEVLNIESPSLMARRILEKLATITHLNEKPIYINASIGIAMYPQDGNTSAELLKNADIAMYCAKTYGKNQYRYFSSQLLEEKTINIHIINGLRNAIVNEEFFLEYQPIIDLKTNHCHGVEALIRWRHPTLGIIAPSDFLVIAEATGMMLSIGQWVIKRSLEEVKKFDIGRHFFLSINISANELDLIETGERIISCLDELAIPPEKVIIELTETSIMQHPNDVIEKLQRLADIGIHIAIDDYGTGYSSLSYIKQLPISIIKIDKSFIDDLGQDPQDSIIIQSTIELAHNLGLKVIAEGVETKEQLTVLKKFGCDYAQGYYFSKSLAPHDLTHYLSKS